MKVYYHGRSANHRMYVVPAHDYPHVGAWREQDGRNKQFEVHFIDGVADVEDNLGEYMIEKGIASASRIILDIKGAA